MYILELLFNYNLFLIIWPEAGACLSTEATESLSSIKSLHTLLLQNFSATVFRWAEKLECSNDVRANRESETCVAGWFKCWTFVVPPKMQNNTLVFLMFSERWLECCGIFLTVQANKVKYLSTTTVRTKKFMQNISKWAVIKFPFKIQFSNYD